MNCFWGCAAAISLATVSAVQAAVTYVDLNPDFGFFSSSSTSRSLDLSAITGDLAGINMVYSNDLVLYDFGEGIREYVNIVDLDFSVMGDRFRFAVADYGGQYDELFPHVAGIQNGQLPDSYGLTTLPFRPEFQTVLRNHMGVVFGTVHNSQGSIDADYLGFTIDSDGPHDDDLSDDLHGWIKLYAALHVDREEETFAAWVYEYAYENTPGKPLPAGFIPEPASAAVLLTLAGLLRIRG
ncbi:MAG: hypothetical protein RLN76_10740 [Phycisphaeraceae bacterium]